MSRLDDDGLSPEVTVVEDEGSNGGSRQALMIRVGLVFHDGEPDADPGIWVEYQQEYMSSPLAGPVLIDVVTWRELSRSVSRRLRHWRRRRLRDHWRRLVSPSEWQ